MKRKFYSKLVRETNIILFFLLLSFFACTDKNEVKVETLAQVYVDLLVIEDYYSNTDSLQIKRQEVFTKYSTSEEIYDSTFKMFSHDSDKWENFFELANTYLDTLKSDLKKSEKLKE